MLQKKRKISKKEIKEDKLITLIGKSQSFFEEPKNKLFMYGVILLAVIAAIYFYVNQKVEDNKEAGLALSRIMKIYDQGSYLEAIEGQQGSNIIGLKKIAEEYDGTENGETAKIYLANAYSLLGNYDEAIKYFKDYSGSIDYYKAAALAGEAGYYASNKDYEKAADLYFNASKISPLNAENPNYLLNAGIYYLKMDKMVEAKEMFQMIRDDYATSNANREIDNYLALVK